MIRFEQLHSLALLIGGFGSLFSGLAALLSFFFGKQSKSSKRKDDQMKKLRFPRIATLWLGIILLCLSAVLFGLSVYATSNRSLNEELTTKAWDAFNSKRYNEAIQFAEKCIKEFSGRSSREQNELEGQNAPLPPKGKVSDEVKNAIWSRGLLNDVATCYFIWGRSAEELGQLDQAKRAYEAASKYTYARCWDIKGWFWSPSEAAKDRLSQLK
jgi:tetratricopeptide (TPR) repeat protein